MSLRVGGKTDDRHGEPVGLAGRVRVITDGRFVYKGPINTGSVGTMGRTVVLGCDGVEVILTEKPFCVHDANLLHSVGIEPADRRILLVKSCVHHRVAFGPIAKQIIEADGPGITTQRLRSLDFRRVRRPISPLDEM